MWEKAEELLSGDGFVLMAAGAMETVDKSLVYLGLTQEFQAHLILLPQIGNEVKCDCPVYRSSPHVCQHILAAANNLGILDVYLQWLKKLRNYHNLLVTRYPVMQGKRHQHDAKVYHKQRRSSLLETDATLYQI